MTAPDGTVWTVRRRRDSEGDDQEDDEEDASRVWSILATLVGAAVVIGALVDARVGLLVFAAEAVLAAVGFAVWLARGPWLIEASRAGPGRDLAWEAKGRRRSRRVVEEVVRALERGHEEIEPNGATRL